MSPLGGAPTEALRARPCALRMSHGDRTTVDELLALRSRCLAARAELDGGRWLELGNTFAFDWRGHRRVQDFGDEALRRFPELLEWFGDGLAPELEVRCGPGLERASEALIVLGYAPFHAHAFHGMALGGGPVAADRIHPDDGLVLSDDPLDYGRLASRMWHEDDPERARALACQHEGPRWICQTLLDRGRPLASGTLFLDGDGAYLANAVTEPSARGRGLHGRLLRARVEQARRQGASWIAADTQVGSGSSRNLERAGLRCIATTMSWRPRDSS